MTGCMLLGLALGYFVFWHASSQKSEVKVLGRIVGLAILTISAGALFCAAMCKMGNSGCGFKSGCDMKSYSCPIKGM